MTVDRAFPITFAVTPRFDLFYALYALTHNAPSVLELWRKRAIGRLPRDFDRVARRVAPVPLFWPLLADSVQHTPGEMTFDEIVSNLREMPGEELKSNVLSGIFHDAASVRALVAGKMSLRQAVASEKSESAQLLRYFGLEPYDASSDAAKALNMLLSNVETFRDELALVLERFWQTGFRRDWSALEPGMRADSFRLRDLEEEAPLQDLAGELKLPVSFDAKAREVRSKSGASIAFDRIERCIVIPSAFNTRRWWAKYETKTGRVSLYFPIVLDAAAADRIVADSWDARAPASRSDINAESVFRALGDTTRYAIASILARSPTTSADLSRSLRVSKPTITHHVQALRAAGLIAETPAGGSTKLSLSRETVAAVSEAALEQLFSSTGDLALVTTRKRRTD
ncbi:MAG TPA: winged helix-turn-helix domain-containing protein [Gemmatimonadaceae bacterium]|nr:winged helix-turn-helix domain-containing protein [Gemmatimonadaceae bacterium]